MQADQHPLLARRAQVPAPTLRARFQPRAPDGRAIKPRLLISAIACLLPAATLAGPKDGQVVAGQSSISTPDANTTIIRQSTDKSVINWQSFSVGTKEYVKFVQPGRSSISLNRVIGGDPSSILGTLSANGQVYLVNPNGIYFGKDAQVDVSGIVASVLDISNTDFMSGNLVFEGSADENLGKVINDGIINARNEGYVVLMGDYSENNGVVQAHMGKVVLASGSRVTMDISGNSLISVAVDEAAVSDLAGVRNTGEIYADGGRVIMTARVADSLIGSAVNNEGLVRASSIVEKDGAIFLTGRGGDVVNSGVLDASAADGSNVDGGGVLVYSDRDVTLSSGAAIHARGDGDGAGGMVRVIAEEVLDHQSGASISVAGSPHSGGFVEVSGHAGLRMRGEVDVGSGGTLLIDPSTFTINTGVGGPTGDGSGNVGSAFLADMLNRGADVFVVAENLITADPGVSITATTPTNASVGVGDLNLAIGTLANSGDTLGSSYLGTGNCSSFGYCLGGSGAMLFNPGSSGNITLGNVNFNLAGGLNVAAGTMMGSVSLGNVQDAASLNVAGGSAAGSVSVGSVNVGGNVTITTADNINFQGSVMSAGGGITAIAGSDINFDVSVRNAAGGLTANAGNNIHLNGGIGPSYSGGGSFNGPINLNANNDVVIDSNIFAGADNINFNADVDGDGSGDVNINGFGSCTEGCFGEPRAVTTRGAINISGANLNVNGVDFGTSTIFGGSDNASVRVSADDNITVNLTGRMTVKGGRVNTMGTADVSVKLSAGNDMNIVAPGGLSVLGGFAVANTTNANTDSATAVANASLLAGRNVGITIAAGDLRLAGGSAIAVASASDSAYSASASAMASAAITAGGTVTVNSVGTDLIISGGDATAVVPNSCGACTVDAAANASIVGGSVSINNVGNDIRISGGNATGVINGGSGLINKAIVQADASALVTATQNVSLNAAGSNTISGGSAINGGSWSSVGMVSAAVKADAIVSAGGNLNVTGVTGLDISGGFAIANPSTAGSTVGTASASAKAELKAGGQATVTVTSGSVYLSGGFSNPGNTGGTSYFSFGSPRARASGSSGTTPLRKAFANASVKAGLLQVTAATDVFGNSADIDAQGIHIAAGNDLHLFNNTITTVGSGAAPGVIGDPLVLDILDKAGIPLPANIGPNLKFQAGGTMVTGDVEVTATNAYLWFETDELSVSNISAPVGPLTVQYSPFTPTLGIVLEDQPPSLDSPPQDILQDRLVQARPLEVNYDNSNFISPFAMTTVIFGGAKQSGPMTVGANGTIDIGARNILLLNTPESVNSPDNIITTGIVATSGFVASLEEVFITPRLDSFEVDIETIWDEIEERKKQLVENQEENHGMCTAL